MNKEENTLETEGKMIQVNNSETLVDIEDVHYRMYCVVLRQLSPIQKGVQGAHSICEYTSQYLFDGVYRKWARDDKTLVLLNARDVQDIYEIRKVLNTYKVKNAIFKEESLDGIVTSISFIFDNHIYDYTEEYEIGDERTYALRKIIETRKLAN